MHMPVEPDIGLLGGINAEVGKRSGWIGIRVSLQEFHLIVEEIEQAIVIHFIEVVRADDEREQVGRARAVQLEFLKCDGSPVFIGCIISAKILDGPVSSPN